MEKKEFRVFLNPSEAEWIEKKVEEGEARTPSEAIRRIVENRKRGFLK